MEPFKISFPGNKKVDVAFKSFEIKTDQTIKNGGDETAPEPFALFLASLGSCAGIFAKSFFDTRKIKTEGMHLTLEAFFKKGQKHIDQLDITLYVGQDFPEKYIKPVIKAMDGCAVKNQLHPDIKTNTSVIYMEI